MFEYRFDGVELGNVPIEMCQRSSRDSVGIWFDRPPYRPDVAPSDFGVFPALKNKKHQGGKKFPSDDEVQEEVVSYLRDAAATWYDTGIQEFVGRTRKVVEREGDCIRK